jgi:hypothetical protein
MLERFRVANPSSSLRRWWGRGCSSAFCGRSGAGRGFSLHGSIRVILSRFACTWRRRGTRTARCRRWGTRTGRCRRRGSRTWRCRDQGTLVDSYGLVGGTIELWRRGTPGGALWCSWNRSCREGFGGDLGSQEHGRLLTMWAGDLSSAHIRRILNALATTRARALDGNQNAHG